MLGDGKGASERSGFWYTQVRLKLAAAVHRRPANAWHSDGGRAESRGLAEHSVGNDCCGRRADGLSLTVSGCGDSLHSCTWSEKAVLAEMMPGLSEHCRYIRRLVPQGSWSRDVRFPAVGPKSFFTHRIFFFLLKNIWSLIPVRRAVISSQTGSWTVFSNTPGLSELTNLSL